MPYTDPEAKRAYDRARYLARRELVLAAAREYRERPEVREARIAYLRDYHAANADDLNAHNRRYRRASRATVLAHYGTVCACCGTTEQLTIDHINGDGAEHRRQMYGHRPKYKAGFEGSASFYRWLIKQGFPPGYQTLCRGCNSSKRGGERCRLQHGEVESNF